MRGGITWWEEGNSREGSEVRNEAGDSKEMEADIVGKGRGGEEEQKGREWKYGGGCAVGEVRKKVKGERKAKRKIDGEIGWERKR